jgi:hypothetical protein
MEPVGKGFNYFLNMQEPPSIILDLFLEVGQFMSMELFIFFKGGGWSPFQLGFRIMN